MIRNSLKISKLYFSMTFNSNKDYYKVLNVKTTATQQQIKKAFRNLAKIHHPDANKGNQEKFKQLNQAYQVLSSQSMKRDYDQVRRSQTSGSTSNANYNTGNSGGFYRNQNTRNQQQQNTYRGYHQQTGWSNRQFREQNIRQMFRRQQQFAYKHNVDSKHDDILKNRNKNNEKVQNLQDQLNQMLRRNMQQIKITRQSVRRAYEQQRKKKQRQFKQYRDKQKDDIIQNAKDKAWKMAEGVKDNVQGIIKAGKYVKQNLEGIAKVGKIAKSLWDQYKKTKK